MDLLNNKSFKAAMQCATGLKLYYVIAYQNEINNISEKICLTFLHVVYKIFDICMSLICYKKENSYYPLMACNGTPNFMPS